MNYITLESSKKLLDQAISQLDSSKPETLKKCHEALEVHHMAQWQDAFDKVALKAAKEVFARSK